MTSEGTGLHALARESVALNYGAFAGIALAGAALQSVPLVAELSPAGSGAGQALASLLQLPVPFLAFYSQTTGHSALARRFPWSRFWRFVTRAVLLGLPAMAAVLLAENAATGFLLAMGLSLGTAAFLGTVLPDTAAGGKGDWRTALDRGRETLAWFFAWTVKGPLLTAVLMGIAFGLFVFLLVNLAGATSNGMGGVRDVSPWMAGLMLILVSLGEVYMGALAAAVLTKCWWLGGGGPGRP